jgi:hypothetical protein
MVMNPFRASWSWRSSGIGFLAACGTLLLVAALGGPLSRTTMEDPLTGRLRHTTEWIGITLYDKIEENDVSAWADANSVAGTYPAQYGWSPVTREYRGWFTGMTIACGGFGIPGRIYRGEIALAGLAPQQTLQQYQSELAAAYGVHGSTIGVQKSWSKQIKSN